MHSGRSACRSSSSAGIYSGIITATEAGGIACVYAVLVSVLIYREVRWTDLGDLGMRASYITAQVMIVLAAAGVYSWLLTTSGAGPGDHRDLQAMGA